MLTEAANETIKGLFVSESSAKETLQMNDLEPHKFRMWLYSKDLEFTEKINDIVDLYINMPEN